jgi:hypothetical protein
LTEFAVEAQGVMPESNLAAALPEAAFSDAYSLVVDEPDVG